MYYRTQLFNSTVRTRYSPTVDVSDPRAIKTRTKILNATCAAIVETGLPAVTMDAVAKRAGISRSTLYRHWSHLPELLVAAIEHVSTQPTTAPPKDPIDRLHVIVEGLGAALRSEPWGTIAAALAECGTRNPELARLHTELTKARRQPAVRAVAAAQRSGALRRDLDAEWIVDALAGPLYYHHLVLHRALHADQVHAHIERVLGLLTN
jgi:AcrR family transcriptional regulator